MRRQGESDSKTRKKPNCLAQQPAGAGRNRQPAGTRPVIDFPIGGCDDASADKTSKSLLLQAQDGAEAAWRRIVELYEPLIRGWLYRQAVPRQEADDLTQDVLALVLKNLKDFRPAEHGGSFRSWLRTITANRAREFWRAGKCRAQAPGGSEFLHVVEQFEDPNSSLSEQWNAEHDEHVLRRLLALMEAEFEPNTVQAFRRLVFDGARAAVVAAELNMSPAAVYGAKSRVLQRLRQQAGEFLA
jgi:RNA polymerase sigma-70 factor (ECF subfamily)